MADEPVAPPPVSGIPTVSPVHQFIVEFPAGGRFSVLGPAGSVFAVSDPATPNVHWKVTIVNGDLAYADLVPEPAPPIGPTVVWVSANVLQISPPVPPMFKPGDIITVMAAVERLAIGMRVTVGDLLPGGAPVPTKLEYWMGWAAGQRVSDAMAAQVGVDSVGNLFVRDPADNVYLASPATSK